MDDLPKLGRLERIKLREVWKREDTVFTPWLAQAENLQLLADAIGVPELELIQTERQVSEFSLDIIARVPTTGEIVAIENQIENSDHRHLGQSIVYAAGTQAKIIVWIVEQFSEGHRAALDWLNRVTSDDIVFFGVEIEAWRIGDSVPAPKLNVVVRPNEWLREARRQTTSSGGGVEGDLNAAYWTAFLETAAREGLALGNKGTRARNVYLYLGNDRKIAVVAYVSRATGKIGAYVGFYTPEGPTLANALEAFRAEIEADLGTTYKVEVRSDASAWIAGMASLDAVIDNQDDWQRQHLWLVQDMKKIRDVFEPRLAKVGAFGGVSDG